MSGVVMACHISEAYNKILEAYVNDQVMLWHAIFRNKALESLKIIILQLK